MFVLIFFYAIKIFFVEKNTKLVFVDILTLSIKKNAINLYTLIIVL